MVTDTDPQISSFRVSTGQIWLFSGFTGVFTGTAKSRHAAGDEDNKSGSSLSSETEGKLTGFKQKQLNCPSVKQLSPEKR